MPIAQDKTYWVYVTASKPHGVLYVGMTSDLAGRTWDHRAIGLVGSSIPRRMATPRLLPSASAQLATSCAPMGSSGSRGATFRAVRIPG